jgi:hypothetical protein
MSAHSRVPSDPRVKCSGINSDTLLARANTYGINSDTLLARANNQLRPIRHQLDDVFGHHIWLGGFQILPHRLPAQAVAHNCTGCWKSGQIQTVAENGLVGIGSPRAFLLQDKLVGTILEASAGTHHDHIYRGQDKSENGPKRVQNAPPEG